MKILILLSCLLLSIPAHVQGEESFNCETTNEIVNRLNFINDYTEANKRNAIADQWRNADTLMLDCIFLQEYKINQTNRDNPLTVHYQPFTDKSGVKPSLEKIFDQCQKSSCKHYAAIQRLLIASCREDFNRSEDECGKLKKPTVINHYGRQPPPTWRKVVGGILIGIGGATAILGATHMGVPVFRSEDGCVKYGLEHPCLTASRFGAGGALLGVGLLAVGGGIFTLTWPTAESKVVEQEKTK